tara:strand:+ start:27322 stop:29325 length:2004 start_codon:yes stop_codon:yes gene_type:complete
MVGEFLDIVAVVMRFEFFLSLLVLSCGCGNAREDKPPAVRATVAGGTEADPSPDVAIGPSNNVHCEVDSGPGAFPCNYQERCATHDGKGPLNIEAFLCQVIATPAVDGKAQTMSELIARLPYRFRRNLTFKHGRQQSMLRGHALEESDLTTTATLEEPRVLMWDEDTGFTISFNGGPIEGSSEDQRSERELHMMAFDDAKAEFSFWSVDLPIVAKNDEWQLHPSQPTDRKVDCRRCHGAVSRPIWAMYPDWPGVFGSDTDELTKKNAHQSFEREALARFRSCVASSAGGVSAGGVSEGDASEAGASCAGVQGDRHQRYAALFDSRMEAGLLADFQKLDRAAIRTYLAEKAAGDARRKPKYRLTKQAMAVVNGGDAEMRAWLGLTQHPNYPYRPNHELQKSEASRAIFHRPNLRAGALYNRLNSLRVLALMRKSPLYERFKSHIAFSLMDCGWGPTSGEAREMALSAFAAAANEQLSQAGMAFPNPTSDGRILYPALLAALGLTLRDVDIRYAYPNARFDVFDENYTEPTMAKTVMDLGYIAYAADDANRGNGARYYFNSYFDGSASFDELLAAQILEELGPTYTRLYTLNSFEFKFRDVTSRYELDKKLFAKMDRLSKWFPLPYPKHLAPLHNRQAFLRKRGGSYPFLDQHTAVCSKLRDSMIVGGN